MINDLLAKFTQKTDSLTKQRPVQAWLNARLHKLNLVSKEEFDTQTAVLSRCQKKIGALELQLKHLEEQLIQQNKTLP